MNKVAAFALRRKNSILSMSEKMFCPPQPLRFWITPACAGKVDVVHLPVVFRGITPACAGKSTQYFPACSCIWDHPRVCGEKLSTTSTDIHPAGSPSRVRGKADFPVRCREHSRITPACVGKRRKPCRRHAANRDHPRVCGEKGLSMFWSLNHSGSPLRVRGKAFGLLCC